MKTCLICGCESFSGSVLCEKHTVEWQRTNYCRRANDAFQSGGYQAFVNYKSDWARMRKLELENGDQPGSVSL